VTYGEPHNIRLSISPSSTRAQFGARLFCFPFAGGGAAAYYRWPQRLPGHIEVKRVNLPGRESRLRELPATRVDSLVKTLADELIPCMDIPFGIFGHSMGALIGFELVRELRRRGHRLPSHLFVSGYRAPQVPAPEAPFSHLPDAEFMNCVRRYGGIPDLIAKNKELMDIFLPILRADFRMTETYLFKDELPLECPITALGGHADPKVSPDKIVAWSKQTCKEFSAHFFRGGHFFIQESESEVLGLVNQKLDESLPLEGFQRNECFR
jgi:medium-chain acyl-[acyl-carrier-protein] hydrolase